MNAGTTVAAVAIMAITAANGAKNFNPGAVVAAVKEETTAATAAAVKEETTVVVAAAIKMVAENLIITGNGLIS